MIGRKKLAETCVPAERARGKTVIRREILAASRIQLVVATDFARTRNGFFLSGKTARQPSLTTLSRVIDEGRAETRETHNFIRLQDVLNQKAIDVAQANVFVAIAEKNYAVRFLAQDPLSFDVEADAVDRRLAHAISQHVDRLSLGIESLHNPERAAVDGRAKKAGDGRVAQVLGRDRQRRELSLAVTKKARIE